VFFVVILAACGLAVVQTRAIDEGDKLPHGQFLVDDATAEIDRQVTALLKRGLARDEVFRGVTNLIDWVAEYNRTTVSKQFPLTDPRGILVTDGVADTLATRLYRVLREYVIANPDEILTEGRQAVELLFAGIPVPPGRFLGFHFQHMAGLYGMQADTLLSMTELDDRAGVEDGYLRHLWNLSQLYHQVHIDAGQRYMCRVSQEDWILQRMVCEKCGNRGYHYRNQRMGMSWEHTAECDSILLNRSSDPEHVARRIDCYHWGHVFTVRCPSCADTLVFSVPLPNYKIMQKEISLGKASYPDVEELMKEY